jgi:Ras-related protein Rab-18
MHVCAMQVGIQQVFSEVVQKILENPALLANTAPGRPKQSLNLSEPATGGSGGGGGCCGL